MSADTELDIRWPIGLLFAVMGGLLGSYGALSAERTLFRPDLGASRALNLNLWWGLIMLAFGLSMLVGAARARKAKPESAEAAKEQNLKSSS